MKFVQVNRKASSIVGMLYFETDDHLVLLNNVFEGAHLGRLRNMRRKHVEPEADIVVVPRHEVVSVDLLKRR